ncbi:MAG: hypothetical protein ACTHXA_08640 [Gulosibacter sp.]|uniref:hypothetical protein n=1 Tax=Gulosibacter sp. TaxID=2817531 RepID=UPI003F92E4BA
MARKRKTLPKNFDELLITAPFEDLVAVFDKCELDARGGYNKATALGFRDCPNELIEWLVAQGLDVDSRDSFGRTGLAERANSDTPKQVQQIPHFLSLGADINAPDNAGDTPFQTAVMNHLAIAALTLLEQGAKTSGEGWDPGTLLEASLARVVNANIVEAAAIARLLTGLGAPTTGESRNRVKQIGENFERYRDVFAEAMLE